MSRPLLQAHILLVFSIATFLCVPTFAFAKNELSLSPSQVSPRIDEVFEVELSMGATQEPINAVSATITYDTSKLELISYRRTSEKVSFWLEKKDNPFDGEIVLEGLLMDQGWQGTNEQLARFAFRVKQPGATEVGVDRGALHAYDGTGDNTLERVTNTIVNVKEGQARPQYEYIAAGISDVDGTLTPDILYDDAYVREHRLVRVMPWWSWLILAIAVLFFLWQWLLIRRLQHRGILFVSNKERDDFVSEYQEKK